jgi:LPXTG-motif cell wall-anchored protein
MDPDFIYGLITGVLVGLAILWFIRRRRGG